MRKLAILLVLFSMANFASAQDGKVEVFGGYSYQRLNPGEGLDGVNLNGWNGAIEYKVNPNFGLVADFSGHYKRESITPFCLAVIGVPCPDGDAKLKEYNFLFGPRISAGDSSNFKPFVHALFGASHLNISALGTDEGDTSFGMALGGGVDLKVSEKVAVRAIQADYLMTRFGDEMQNNARLSFGLVFRF